MRGTEFLDRLKERFGDRITGANLEALDPWIEVSPEGLLDVSRYLRDEPDAAVQHAQLHHGGRLFRARREESGQGDLEAASRNGVSPVERAASGVARDESDVAAMERRSAGRVARGAVGEPHLAARPIGTNAKSTISRASASWAIPICGASSARKIGSATRCAKTTKCRWNITE